MQNTATQQNQAFLLKGGAFTLTTVQLLTLDLSLLDQQLAEKVATAPKFFDQTPVVVDLGQITPDQTIDFLQLIACLRRNSLVPIGIRGGDKTMQQAALAQGLACLPDVKTPRQKPVLETVEKIDKPTAVPQPEPLDKSEGSQSTAKIITQPVRSGQQVYARGGDLIVLATVSHGAEVLADGHIHIYAPLRGRALAGVMGDKDAKVFCQCLEAELVSIAGQYRISEQLKEVGWQQSVQIALEGGHLRISPL